MSGGGQSGGAARLVIINVPGCGSCVLFFFQAEDGIRDLTVTGVQTCALPISGDEVKVWNAEPRQPAAIIQTEQEWGWPAISPDGKWLVTAATIATKDYPESQRDRKSVV